MKILILGGKRFLGLALTDAILQAGHTPTLFNRGRTNTHLYPDIENLIGDRDSDLEALKDRTWDAVIDTSGYLPRIVKQSAKRLSGHCDTYVFISSLSVYKNFRKPDITEAYPLAELEDRTSEQNTDQNYGPLKALCEYEIQKNFDGNELVLRPGLIVGPNDPTDRFSYWLWRVSQGGAVLAPAPPSSSLQFIDVRDVAAFIIHLVEQKEKGVFNATGPKKPTTFGSLLIACREASGSEAKITWVDEFFLLNEGVRPWRDLPLWLPSSDPNVVGFYNINIDKALKAGLQFHPVSQTVKDTLKWLQATPEKRQIKTGLSLSREVKLLLKYQQWNQHEV
jgi:2'-hydroxyisoflavone reductase